MQALSRRNRAALHTARSGVRAYGAFKHTQGRLSRRDARRAQLAGAAGSGIAVGLLVRTLGRRERRRDIASRVSTEVAGAMTAADPSPAAAQADGRRSAALAR